MRTPIVAVAAVAALLGGALGCNALLGVTFGDAILEDGPVAQAPGPDGSGGGGGEVDSGRVDRCAGKKVCDVSGDCVTPSPENGCGDPSCKACSAPFAAAFYCDKEGKCQVDGNAPNAGCAPGRGDCDKTATNGCEASFNNPQTCGGCKTSCDAVSTPLCSPIAVAGDAGADDGGSSVSDTYRCGATCALGSTQCGNSCVNIAGSVDHCGACNKACGAVANGSPACRAGACGAVCSAGYSDCTNPTAPKTCAPTPKWYRDEDGDGFGSGTAISACAAPAGFTARTGDCDDKNREVFPGQTRLFGAPYSVGGVATFDYNCDGLESGPITAYPGSCGARCDASGYLSTGRSGKGVNAYCGSRTVRTCDPGGIVAQPQIQALPTSTAPTCSSGDYGAAAAACN